MPLGRAAIEQAEILYFRPPGSARGGGIVFSSGQAARGRLEIRYFRLVGRPAGSWKPENLHTLKTLKP